MTKISTTARGNTLWEIHSVDEIISRVRVRKFSSAESLVRAVSQAWFHAKQVADARIHNLEQDDEF